MSSSTSESAPELTIPSPTTILQLRTGKLAPFGPVKSGIVKYSHQGLLYVSQNGIGEDEHDLTFHGGPDKVVHQYNAEHYPGWREEYPDAAEQFQEGSFGENLVTRGWSEENVCVGDVVKIGYADDSQGQSDDPDDMGCVLEVSLPRQPCFKLNQRFGLKNFAPKTHASNRTGWYYRLLQEGWIKQGMQMTIIKRPHSQWSISRLHHYVHRAQDDIYAIETLRALPGLGGECAGIFQDRWEKLEEAKRQANVRWRSFKLKEKEQETPRIQTFVFEAVVPEDKEEAASLGSHVSIKLPNGLQRGYSVVAGHSNRFRLGVARDENSRGGSVFMHDHLREGDVIEAGSITQSLGVSMMASKHVMIAGGIGITAFPIMLAQLTEVNYEGELHYCVRNADEVAFRTEFEAYGDRVKIYDGSKGQRLNILELLRNRTWNSHVYVCGPTRMIEAVQNAAVEVGMSEDEVHFETFKVDASGDPFTVDVKSSEGEKKGINVSASETLLEALRTAGFDVGSSCEAGNCGTCKVALKCGRVKHVGTGLTKEEKETQMLSCVSRGIGHIEIVVE